jgi:hypothetical protein
MIDLIDQSFSVFLGLTKAGNYDYLATFISLVVVFGFVFVVIYWMWK